MEIVHVHGISAFFFHFESNVSYVLILCYVLFFFFFVEMMIYRNLSFYLYFCCFIIKVIQLLFTPHKVMKLILSKVTN